MSKALWLENIVGVIQKPVMKGFSQLSTYVLLKKAPEFVFSKNKLELYAESMGFAELYTFEKPWGRFQAFAGREFELKLDDGGVEKCKGQWWWCDSIPDFVSVGWSTQDRLDNCYVFNSGHLSREILNEWLSKNKPFEDYYHFKSDGWKR